MMLRQPFLSIRTETPARRETATGAVRRREGRLGSNADGLLPRLCQPAVGASARGASKASGSAASGSGSAALGSP